MDTKTKREGGNSFCPVSGSAGSLFSVTFLTDDFLKEYSQGCRQIVSGKWYDWADRSGFKSFQAIISTLTEHHDGVLNFFVNRSTNAFAECFNAKIKQFRALLRGVIDIPFFLFRLTKIYA